MKICLMFCFHFRTNGLTNDIFVNTVPSILPIRTVLGKREQMKT